MLKKFAAHSYLVSGKLIELFGKVFDDEKIILLGQKVKLAAAFVLNGLSYKHAWRRVESIARFWHDTSASMSREKYA